MKMTRRGLLAATGAAVLTGLPAQAAQDRAAPVLATWVRLVLELVRHTPTYSPPVASRAFAYLGITAHEVFAALSPDMRSLSGQLPGLAAWDMPAQVCDAAIALNAALSVAVRAHFGNTGPTGQRAMTAMEGRMTARVEDGVAPGLIIRSRTLGQTIADRIIGWAAEDGGAQVENMGFPLHWAVSAQPGHWQPTSTLGQQQAPLLPGWGNNRTFAMPSGAACPLPPPPAYSETPGSAFHREAQEVVDITRTLTEEQRLIARFWSDDPMLSPTPPGHWISILMAVSADQGLAPRHVAEGLALLGIAMADAFIACWHEKYVYDLVRPVTYIRKVIDPGWQPLLITPPFPEYPSGHSTQSGAAAAVLDTIFGADFAFVDATHADDGMAPRPFPSFQAAAREAALSRLYGGIHFRAAIDRGLDQGACVGAHALTLRTRA